MVTVKLTEKMSLEKALKKFKKELDRDNVIQEYMDHARYVKPSARKHQKKVKAKHILKKIAEAERKESDKTSWMSFIDNPSSTIGR